MQYVVQYTLRDLDATVHDVPVLRSNIYTQARQMVMALADVCQACTSGDNSVITR